MIKDHQSMVVRDGLTRIEAKAASLRRPWVRTWREQPDPLLRGVIAELALAALAPLRDAHAMLVALPYREPSRVGFHEVGPRVGPADDALVVDEHLHTLDLLRENHIVRNTLADDDLQFTGDAPVTGEEDFEPEVPVVVEHRRVTGMVEFDLLGLEPDGHEHHHSEDQASDGRTERQETTTLPCIRRAVSTHRKPTDLTVIGVTEGTRIDDAVRRDRLVDTLIASVPSPDARDDLTERWEDEHVLDLTRVAGSTWKANPEDCVQRTQDILPRRVWMRG